MNGRYPNRRICRTKCRTLPWLVAILQNTLNWNDLRTLLAVARHGTLAEAATALAVDQTTVARRLRALERVCGTRLLDRVGGRYVATAAGEAALQRAGQMEEAAFALLSAVGERAAVPGGSVRLTAIQELIAAFLVPNLPGFRARYPEIALELIGDSGNLSLTRREADLALRLARPRDGTFVMRKLAALGFAVYGPAEDEPPDDLSRADWIAFDDGLAHLPEAQWLLREVAPSDIVLRTNGLRSQIEAVRAGLGLAVLPCLIADPEPGLRRIGDGPVLSRELWLLIHPELRDTQRIRAVTDWLVGLCTERAAAIMGRTSA